MKIYIFGLVAYETAARLYEENRKLFDERFPKFFLREFVNLPSEGEAFSSFLDNLCIEKNTSKLYSRKNFYFDGRLYAREILDGGLFAALWAACEDLEELILESKRTGPALNGVPEVCRRSGSVGCRVNLDEIPVDQHVIELLEVLKESPYEVSSKDSWLILSEEELPGLSPIGKITENKERVIICGESQRFLTPVKRQEKDIADRKSGNRS